MTCLVKKQFTQTDPMPTGGGSAFVSAYVYAANNPMVYSDPSGQREAVVALNPVKTAGQESAPGWLLKKAKETAHAFWSSSFGAQTTGFCGDLSLDFVISYEAQGCFVDDGSRLGSIEFGAAGVGTPGVGATAEIALSNARRITDLGGNGVCVGVGVGELIVGSGAVCWGVPAQIRSLGSLSPSMLSSTWFINAGVGFGLEGLPFAAGGHVVFGVTKVQEIWKYPWVVKKVCGRVIGNPLKNPLTPVCPVLR